MTMTTATTATEGYRDDLDAHVHDVDDRDHRVAVDFPIAVDSSARTSVPAVSSRGGVASCP